MVKVPRESPGLALLWRILLLLLNSHRETKGPGAALLNSLLHGGRLAQLLSGVLHAKRYERRDLSTADFDSEIRGDGFPYDRRQTSQHGAKKARTHLSPCFDKRRQIGLTSGRARPSPNSPEKEDWVAPAMTHDCRFKSFSSRR